jgi:hypothetical protein
MQSHPHQSYVVDSLPASPCATTTPSSAAGSIPLRSMNRLFGATLRASAATSTVLRVHLLVSGAGEQGGRADGVLSGARFAD